MSRRVLIRQHRRYHAVRGRRALKDKGGGAVTARSLAANADAQAAAAGDRRCEGTPGPMPAHVLPRLVAPAAAWRHGDHLPSSRTCQPSGAPVHRAGMLIVESERPRAWFLTERELSSLAEATLG